MTAKRLVALAVLGLACGMLVGCGGGSGAPGGSGPGGARSAIAGRAVDPSGNPISGAQVALTRIGASRAEPIETTTTNVSGSFTLTNVAAGTYTVSVTDTATGGAPVTVDVTVTVPAGTTINITVTINASITPPPTEGFVLGHVIGANSGDRIDGALVTMTVHGSSSGPTFTAVTNDDGFYHIPNVPPGLYDISASLNGAISVVITIEVRAGESTQADLALPGD